MQDLLNTRRKNFFFNFFQLSHFIPVFFSIDVPKRLYDPSVQAPDTSTTESAPAERTPVVRASQETTTRRTSDFRSGHDIRIRLPARDITFDTLATDNRRTQSSRRENRTRSLAIQISAHAADLKITRIRNPVRCNRLNRRQRTKILDLRIAKLPFHHIDPIHPTKRNTFSTLADYLRKRTYQNGIYYHLTRDGMGVCDTRIALR